MVGDENALQGGAGLDDPVTGSQSTQPQQNQQEGSRANRDWELTQAEMISPLKSVEAFMRGKMLVFSPLLVFGCDHPYLSQSNPSVCT